jgi:hypothetical protein
MGFAVSAYRTYRITRRWTNTFLQLCPNGFYFRIAGYGLDFEKDSPVHFRERYRMVRVLRIGRWSVRALYPW